MHMIKKTLKCTNLAIAVFASFFAIAQPSGEIVEGVTAVVGKNIILKSEVDQQYDAFKRQGVTNTGLTRCEVFEELLFQKLLVHHAEIDSVIVCTAITTNCRLKRHLISTKNHEQGSPA